MFSESYLTLREQVISVCGGKSDASLLSYGIPQGSVLEPIMFALYTQPFSDVIDRHSTPSHMFADDTELYKSETRDNTDSVLTVMQACVSDFKQWTLHKHCSSSHTESLMIVQNDIMFSDSARNYGVMFDKTLSMKVQVGTVCQGAYVELRRIGSIRQYLSIDATKTLETYLVLSRLDYCNFLTGRHSTYNTH